MADSDLLTDGRTESGNLAGDLRDPAWATAGTTSHLAVFGAARGRRTLKVIWKQPHVEWLSELTDQIADLPFEAEEAPRGTRPVAMAAVRRLLEFARTNFNATTRAPVVVPTPTGGIQIEWHTRGVELEIEVPPQGPAMVVYEDRVSGEEWDGDLADLVSAVREVIDRLS